MTLLATIGVIGSGHIGEAVAKLLIDAGNTVIMSNHHGSESLKDLINALGPKAKAGTPAEAGQQDIVILAVLRPGVADALAKTPDWTGKIIIDATNELPDSRTDPAYPGSELVAHLAPGAHVIKAFNTLFARYITGETAAGKRVLFYGGDDADSKKTAAALFEKMGFAPVDLGTLKEASPMMEFGAPLSGTHFIQTQE